MKCKHYYAFPEREKNSMEPLGSASVGRQIAAKFASRLVPKGKDASSIRPDLYVADWKKADKDSAKVLVGWASVLNAPTSEVLDNFVLAQFEGKLQLSLPTIRIFPNECAASFIVKHLAPTRRLADTQQKNIIKIAPLRYLEAGTDRTWDVREGEDGTKHLVLVMDNNLEDLLEQRKRAIKTRRSSTPSFSRIAHTKGLLQVDIGDTVKFYYNGLLKEGKVSWVKNDNTFSIKTADANCVVGFNSIIDIVNKDTEVDLTRKERIRRYWESIYPKDYVDRWLGLAE